MVWGLLLFACRGPVAPVATPTQALMHVVVVSERGGTRVGEPLPTVVALHGLGDRPEDFIHALDGLLGPVRVVAVQAPQPWGEEGRAWWTRRVASGDWEALSGDVAAAADALEPLLEQLGQDNSVCGKPVVTGFSQGGMLSFALAGRHPEHIAGAVPVSGMILDGVATSTWAPTRALHGDADIVVPFAPTHAAVARLSAAGEDVSLQAFPGVEHRIPSTVRQAWYRELQGLLPTCE
ncbi:MAG: phospholipase/carboxylesterase [Myxococcota bacterium]|jgi:phospholipase/carboxylesterase